MEAKCNEPGLHLHFGQLASCLNVLLHCLEPASEVNPARAERKRRTVLCYRPHNTTYIGKVELKKIHDPGLLYFTVD